MLEPLAGPVANLFELLAEAPVAWLPESEARAAHAENSPGSPVLEELTQQLTHAVATTLIPPGEEEEPASTPALEPGQLPTSGQPSVSHRLPAPAAQPAAAPAHASAPSGEHHVRGGDVGRPPRHLIGACSVVAVVPKALAKARLGALRQAAAAAAAGDDQQDQQQQQQRVLQRPWEDFELCWYAQAAVVCQPEAPAGAATEQAATAGGCAGGRRRGRRGAGASDTRGGDGGEEDAVAGNGDGGGGTSAGGGGGGASRMARLCFAQQGAPAGISEPAERGVRRAAWDEYGMKLQELSCGSDGRGVLLYGHTNGLQSGDAPPWSLTHLVLGLFLDTRPLQALEAQLALLGDYRPLPRRLAQLAPALEAQLVRAAVAGALAEAKAQLHAAVATHGSVAGGGGGGGGDAFQTGSFLMGRLETRLNVAVPVVADALASIIRRAYNPNLAPYACRLLDCQAGALADALYGKLYDNITEAAAAQEVAKARRKRGRGGDAAGDGDGGGDGDAAAAEDDGAVDSRPQQPQGPVITGHGEFLILEGDVGEEGEAAEEDWGWEGCGGGGDEDGVAQRGGLATHGSAWGEYGMGAAGEGGGWAGDEREPYGAEEERDAAEVEAEAEAEWAAWAGAGEEGWGPEEAAEMEAAAAGLGSAPAVTRRGAAGLCGSRSRTWDPVAAAAVACSQAARGGGGGGGECAPVQDRSRWPSQRQQQQQQQQHHPQQQRPKHAVAAVGALLGVQPLRTVVVAEGGDGEDDDDDWAF
ncbi:hypothetical protein PLESTM_001518200 [Pleodorina starrii]|nr:hypothetical protein PLESTM_001518200 [Pleodorina starrii]